MAAVQRKKKVAKPPVLFNQTQKLVSRIDAKLDGTLLTYWNSPNGSICQNDVVGFYEILQFLDKKKGVYLFIKSDGGTGEAALRIVNMLREHTSRVVALVPLNCVSAATMLALGADEIQMGPLAFLTAVDTSVTHHLSPVDKDNELVSVGHDELSRILELWKSREKGSGNPYPILFQHIHPLAIGAVARASSLSIRICSEILSYHMKDKRKAKKISTCLNSDYPSHTYPITIKEASRIGLNVKPLDPEVNNLLIELNELYSEMGQRAYTDFDERNYHDNEILNILEGPGAQIYYQIDKDWYYRTESNRWAAMNDKSSWRKIERKNGRTIKSIFHVR